MPWYTPSTLAVERASQGQDNAPTLVCPSCGDTMKHRHTIPKLGVRPEKFIFVCPYCKEVDTREIRLVA
jgi:uncharacterized protein YbaR (Trm112 family)